MLQAAASVLRLLNELKSNEQEVPDDKGSLVDVGHD
jgi:hypothetical protein